MKKAFINSDPVKPLTGWFVTNGGHTQEYYIDGNLVSVSHTSEPKTEEDMRKVDEYEENLFRAWDDILNLPTEEQSKRPPQWPKQE